MCSGIIHLLIEMTRQAASPLYSDAHIYFLMGRGLLNGIDPYTDLFETKPFGIFLITALSLLVTGDQRLAGWMQSFVLVGIPCILAVYFWIKTRALPKEERREWILLAVLVGLVGADYAAVRAGYIQTESFGAFFSLCYLLTVLWKNGTLSAKRIGLAGLFLMAAAGMKEPFALIAFACVLLVSQTRAFILRAIIYPGIIAAGLGTLVLAIFGYVHSFYFTYLPFMFHQRIYERGSPWARAFDVWHLLKDLYDFSPFFLFIAVVSFFSVLFLAINGARKYRVRAFSVLTVSSPFIAVAVMKKILTGEPAAGIQLLVGAVVFSVLWFLLRLLADPEERFVISIRTLLLTVLLYSASLAVGLAGPYYPHQFVFALPAILFLIVLLFYFAQLGEGSPFLHRWLRWSILVPSALMVLTFANAKPLLKEAILGHPLERDLKGIAMQFDALMDACKADRYLAYGWELEDLWARTTHSPLGSSYMTFLWNIERTIPAFSERFVNNINRAQIIVLLQERVEPFDLETGGQLLQIFTRTPPACAEGHLPIKDFVFLFRHT